MTKKKDPSELARRPVPEDGLKPAARANKKYRHKYPEKSLAHTKVNEAKRTKRLAPQPCESCGGSRAQAHHEDYSQPLAVRWLCQKCHSKEHYRPLSEDEKAAREMRERQHRDKQNKKRKAKRFLLAVQRASRKTQRAAEAQQLRLEGKTYAEIGEVLGISKSQAFKVANEPGYH